MPLSTDSGPDDFPDLGAGTGGGLFDDLGLPETIFFGLVITFIVVVFVLVVVAAVRNWRYMRRNDLDPMTAQAQLLVAASRSRALAPELTLEQRLESIEELHRAGKITDEERSAARAKLLAGE